MIHDDVNICYWYIFMLKFVKKYLKYNTCFHDVSNIFPLYNFMNNNMTNMISLIIYIVYILFYQLLVNKIDHL